MRSLSSCLIACSTLLLSSVVALCFRPAEIEVAVRARAAITSVRVMRHSLNLFRALKEIAHAGGLATVFCLLKCVGPQHQSRPVAMLRSLRQCHCGEAI